MTREEISWKLTDKIIDFVARGEKESANILELAKKIIEGKMTNEEALNICKMALKVFAVKHSEMNTPYEKEEFEKQIQDQFNVRLMVEALEKQIALEEKYHDFCGYDLADKRNYSTPILLKDVACVLEDILRGDEE